MSLLMLRPEWPGTFHRYVRNSKGEIKRRLLFESRKPIELKGRDLAAVQDDIGPALMEVELDGKGRPRVKKQPEPVSYTQVELDAAVAAAKTESGSDSEEQRQDDPQRAANAMV